MYINLTATAFCYILQEIKSKAFSTEHINERTDDSLRCVTGLFDSKY